MANHTRNGFTLIETLVAVAILATSIVGPFVAIHTAINASYSARDQLVATMLAQEGIEYVRSVRDGNYLYKIRIPTTTRTWFYGLDSTGGVDCTSPRQCTVDPVGTTQVAQCGSGGTGTCNALNFIPTSGLYTQSTPSGYVSSVFTRSITLTAVGTTEMQVTSTVTFTSAHKSYTVTLTERLSDWL